MSYDPSTYDSSTYDTGASQVLVQEPALIEYEVSNRKPAPYSIFSKLEHKHAIAVIKRGEIRETHKIAVIVESEIKHEHNIVIENLLDYIEALRVAEFASKAKKLWSLINENGLIPRGTTIKFRLDDEGDQNVNE